MAVKKKEELTSPTLTMLQDFYDVTMKEFKKSSSSPSSDSKEVQSWMKKAEELLDRILEEKERLEQEAGLAGNEEKFWIEALDKLRKLT